MVLEADAQPLWITPLLRCESEEPDIGHYEVLQRLVSQSPDEEQPGAEIETALELYVGPKGIPLWRRVVVRSGPTCPKQVIHASFQLPNSGDGNGVDMGISVDSHANSMLCWAAFPERPNHKLLCVLANPTILCIWDVYPKGKDSSLVGEGHSIPLPFEASGIHALPGGQPGLLIQRIETMEDHIDAQNKVWTRLTASGSGLDIADDEDAFLLKGPPRPVRTSLDTLNISAATNNQANAAIPSLFSLSHPLDDVLPVSNLSPALYDEESHHHHKGIALSQQQTGSNVVTDVFEKILFVGELTWVQEMDSYLDRQEYSRPVCVTYHTQLRRHAIWEIQEAPAPPPQAPLWQVSSQWRSEHGWSSHLGVFQQDLEDMELLGTTSGLDGGVDVSHYDSATRNDALADALGIRKTPRKAVEDMGPRNRNAGARPGSRGPRPSQGKAGLTNNNMSLLTPLSRGANNDSTFMTAMDVDISTETVTAKPPLLTMGPFASLHPKTSMRCLFEETKPTAEAKEIFIASNLTGSGRLMLCMVVPSREGGTANSLKDKELRLFSFEARMDGETTRMNSNTGEICTGLDKQFKIQAQESIPCVSALPVESSPVTSCYCPHPKHRKSSWRTSAVDILVLRESAKENQSLTLYRGSLPIVNCAVQEEFDLRSPVPSGKNLFALRNSVGGRLDLLYRNRANEITTVRASISLKMSSGEVSERILSALQCAILDMDGLSSAKKAELAIKLRSDCVRLENTRGSSTLVDIGPESIGAVLEATFRFELFGKDINAGSSEDLPVDTPSMDSAWEQLLQTDFHKTFEIDCPDFLFSSSAEHGPPQQSNSKGLIELSRIFSFATSFVNGNACHVSLVYLRALHALYEDYKLFTSGSDLGLQTIGTIIARLSLVAKPNCNAFLEYYRRDLGEKWYALLGVSEQMNEGSQAKSLNIGKPFSILAWLDEIVSGKNAESAALIDVQSINSACSRTRSIVRLFQALYASQDSTERILDQAWQRDYAVIRILIEEGYKDQVSLRDGLPAGVALPLLEVLHRCRSCHPTGGAIVDDPIMWSLIGREDLRKNSETRSQYAAGSFGLVVDKDQASNYEDKDLDGICPLEFTSSMLFPDDNRIREVGRLLRSSRPVYLSVPRAIEVSDHDYERLKQDKLLLLSRRVLALPLGRGMLTIGNLQPVPGEPLPFPELCLVGRIPPANAMLALDTSECPSDMKMWPDFQNGVAAGLRLPLENEAGELISKITRTWIVYNRPGNQQAQTTPNPNTNSSQDLGHAHGGLLMALGLRGHLTTLEMTDIFDYLTQGSVTTTVGVLLGMAANMRGTCDISASKMLCLHIPSLIPQHFSAIDVASPVQAAAVSGAGLLYQGSSHRMMTEFLLNEIGKRPSNDVNVVDREAYALSCGIALGMVNLGRGEGEGQTNGNAGLADLRIEERLYRYIVGGIDDAEMRRRREEGDRLSLPTTSNSSGSEKCSCVYEGDSINTDVTAPGATLALGLIYMMSGNKTIASALALPDTHFLLEYVRPDFLMLRVISRSLILWDDVKPSSEWVDSQLPVAVKVAYHSMRKQAENLSHEDGSTTPDMDKDFDRQAVRLIYAHIVAGACFSIGLRFAGTGDRKAAAAIYERVMEFRNLRDGADPVFCALRPAAPVLEMCLGCAAVSLSLVQAGTGDLETLRLLKVLRWRCDEEVNYGSHMAYASAIGLLFLGGGTCVLGREKEDIAALVTAFYPRFPSTTSDNQYHLQALRNLYALAVKRRDLRTIDVDTNESVFVPVEVKLNDQSIAPVKLTAPCLLSNTDSPAVEIRVVSDRYYPVGRRITASTGAQVLFVKRRSAHLSYKQDPESKRSLLVQTGSLQGINPMDLIASFTDDSSVLSFAKHFCGINKPRGETLTVEPFSLEGFCVRVLFECLVQDTQEAISIYLALRAAIKRAQKGCQSALSVIWDFRLIRSYYTWRSRVVEEGSPRILNSELVAYLYELLEKAMREKSPLSFGKQGEGSTSTMMGPLSVLYDVPFVINENVNLSFDSDDRMDLG